MGVGSYKLKMNAEILHSYIGQTDTFTETVTYVVEVFTFFQKMEANMPTHLKQAARH